MLERPHLPDESIIDALQKQYGLEVITLEFLPIGNDATSWVYKVITRETTYFLKVKLGEVNPANLIVPRYLYESGIKQVVSPLPNRTHALITPLDPFRFILYPFIFGETGMKVGLTQQQCTEFGGILKQVHSSRFPPEIMRQVPRESFVVNKHWMNTIRAIQSAVSGAVFKDDLEQQLAAFWREHSQEIDRIISRTEELGRLLQAQSLSFVLCHADIHTANILIDKAGQLFIVDWDQPIFAPKERDLIFVVGGRDLGLAQVESEQAFLDSYGQPEMNWLAIVYYRYEWVVQEMADFGERVFLSPDTGVETKKDAVKGFQQLFLPDDVVASAYASESNLRT